MLKILFIPDIVGKVGRHAVKQYLPTLKKKYRPDVIIANVENLAHGIGATQTTLDEMKELGIDIFTSGNHIWEKAGSDEMLDNPENRLIRPANYPNKKSGVGVIRVDIGQIKLSVVNLSGKVYFGWGQDADKKEILHSPFTVLEKIIAEDRQSIYIVDLHADATSEKMALAGYFAGRVSAVIGTHTHVQTADEKILDSATAFITDAGMVGYYDSVIGADKQQVWNLFLGTGKSSKKHDLPASGQAIFNAIYLEIDKQSRQAKKIERINKVIEVK